jgi:hypothetical protein
MVSEVEGVAIMVSCQIRNGSKEVAPLTNLLTYRLSLCEGLFVTFFFCFGLAVASI